jgi:hypothetical protein
VTTRWQAATATAPWAASQHPRAHRQVRTSAQGNPGAVNELRSNVLAHMPLQLPLCLSSLPSEPAAKRELFAAHVAAAGADVLLLCWRRHPTHQSWAARHPVLAQTRESLGHRHLLLLSEICYMARLHSRTASVVVVGLVQHGPCHCRAEADPTAKPISSQTHRFDTCDKGILRSPLAPLPCRTRTAMSRGGRSRTGWIMRSFGAQRAGARRRTPSTSEMLDFYGR